MPVGIDLLLETGYVCLLDARQNFRLGLWKLILRPVMDDIDGGCEKELPD